MGAFKPGKININISLSSLHCGSSTLYCPYPSGKFCQCHYEIIIKWWKSTNKRTDSQSMPANSIFDVIQFVILLDLFAKILVSTSNLDYNISTFFSLEMSLEIRWFIGKLVLSETRDEDEAIVLVNIIKIKIKWEKVWQEKKN